jgi:hypothetical protein
MIPWDSDVSGMVCSKVQAKRKSRIRQDAKSGGFLGSSLQPDFTQPESHSSVTLEVSLTWSPKRQRKMWRQQETLNLQEVS